MSPTLVARTILTLALATIAACAAPEPTGVEQSESAIVASGADEPLRMPDETKVFFRGTKDVRIDAKSGDVLTLFLFDSESSVFKKASVTVTSPRGESHAGPSFLSVSLAVPSGEAAATFELRAKATNGELWMHRQSFGERRDDGWHLEADEACVVGERCVRDAGTGNEKRGWCAQGVTTKRLVGPSVGDVCR